MVLRQVFLGLRKFFFSCIIPVALHVHILMHVFPATGKFVPSEVGQHWIENKLQYTTTHITMNPSHIMLGLFLLHDDDGD